MNLFKLEKEVPFDQFSRQYQVSEILRQLRIGSEPLNILDVGGYNGRTRDFLFDDNVTVVDLYDAEDEGYVKGSALNLPFAADSFDYVLSFDVLEHIPAQYRDKFIKESARVAQKGVIICAPHKTELNQAAEQKLNEFYKRLHRKPHQWLDEHIDLGIPDFNLVDKKMQNLGLFTQRLHSNKTQLWLAMQQAIFINSKFPLASEKLLELNSFYNKNFKYDGGGSEDGAYRQIICGLTDKKSSSVIKKKTSELNTPINPLLEMELTEKINEYTNTLISKTNKLASNYKKIDKFHRQQIKEYQLINEQLANRIRNYEKRLHTNTLNRVRQKLRGNKNA